VPSALLVLVSKHTGVGDVKMGVHNFKFTLLSRVVKLVLILPHSHVGQGEEQAFSMVYTHISP